MIHYLEGNKINYGRLLTDEILAGDRLLVEAAKMNMDVAGIYHCLSLKISIFIFLKISNNL